MLILQASFIAMQTGLRTMLSMVAYTSATTGETVEHVVMDKVISGMKVQTPSELSGYVRIETDDGHYLLVADEDWVIA